MKNKAGTNWKKKLRIYVKYVKAFFKILFKHPKYIAFCVGMLVIIIAAIVLLVNVFTHKDLPKAGGKQEVVSQDEEDYAVDYSQHKVTSEMWYGMMDVDIAGLQAVNPETVGWLYFEDADISYPIMYSGDDDKYLHTDFNGQENSAGSIFLEGENKTNFQDMHTLIYGHNMKNESMFGALRRYKEDETYYDDHQYFQIITTGYDGEIVKYRYHIIAYKDVSVNDDIYYVLDSDYEDMDTFIYNEVKRDSMVNVSIPAGNDKHIITLSTCTTTDDNRFVVSAIRCGECVIK